MNIKIILIFISFFFIKILFLLFLNIKLSYFFLKNLILNI